MSMLEKKFFFPVALLLILLFGCYSDSKPKDIEELTIAFQEWVGYGPLYLAAEKGFFKDEGLRLKFIDEQLDSARRDAFLAGMLDCEAGTIDLLISKRAQGASIVAVMELDLSYGSDGIVVNEEIKSLEDLSGKKVVLTRGDVGENFIAYLFKKQGLSLDGVTIISRRLEDVAEVFLEGGADAVVTWQPWIAKALKRPGSHILVTSRDEPGIIIDVLNVREDLLKTNPGSIKKLMRGWFKAVAWYKQHPQEASEIVAKYYNISPQAYQEQVKGLKWLDYQEQLKNREIIKWREAFDLISEIKFKNSKTGQRPLFDKSIDRTLLKTLYEDSQ